MRIFLKPVMMGRGPTNDLGLVTLTDFAIMGPAGLYTLVPSAGGFDSTEAFGTRGTVSRCLSFFACQGSSVLVSTPVASIEVVNLSTCHGWHLLALP